jgi:DUF1680 family protein
VSRIFQDFKPAVVTVNDKVEEGAGKPSTYVSVECSWKAGDVIVLLLPVSLRLEREKDDSSMVSVFQGASLDAFAKYRLASPV